MVLPPLKTVTCCTCGKAFTYEYRGKRYRKYCSAACIAHTRRPDPNAGRLYHCDQCGVEYRPFRTQQRFCSGACRSAWAFKNNPAYREKCMARAAARLKTVAGRRLAKCRNKIKKYRRRLLIGASLESFHPTDVFKRDRWRCQLCGCKVTRATGEYSPTQATLDHIVPLSRGGSHTTANVQTACRQCNSKKHTKIVGQFRLF